MIREGEGVAAQVLQKLGAELIEVRQALIVLIGTEPAEEPPPRRYSSARAWSAAQRELPTGLVALGGPPGTSGFIGVTNRETPFGIVGLLSALFALVAIVAVLVERPLANLAGAGLISLIGGVVVSTLSAAVHLRPWAPQPHGSRFATWVALVALVLFAAGALLLGLDALLD